MRQTVEAVWFVSCFVLILCSDVQKFAEQCSQDKMWNDFYSTFYMPLRTDVNKVSETLNHIRPIFVDFKSVRQEIVSATVFSETLNNIGQIQESLAKLEKYRSLSDYITVFEDVSQTLFEAEKKMLSSSRDEIMIIKNIKTNMKKVHQKKERHLRLKDKIRDIEAKVEEFISNENDWCRRLLLEEQKIDALETTLNRHSEILNCLKLAQKNVNISSC